MPAATNQAIAGLKIIAPNVERDYLYHWLKAQEAVSKMAGRGAAQSNINLTILRNMEIIIPDIETQKSLIRQFNVIEKQKILAQKQLTKLDQLIKFRFVEMFGEEVEEKTALNNLIKANSSISYGNCATWVRWNWKTRSYSPC